MGSLLCHLPCKRQEEKADTEVLMQLMGGADMTSVTGLQGCKPVKADTFPTPSLYSQQVHRLAGTVTPVRAAGAVPVPWLQWKKGPREYVTAERQAGVYQRGWGSSCSWISLGTSSTYSTAPLLLLPTHWEPAASSSPSLPSLLEPLPSLRALGNWLGTAAEEISSAQACPPFPYILSPHLPLALQLCLHPTHPFTFLHLSPPCLHWWWQMADSYLSHICLHITLLTQASFVTIILFSCSNLSLEFVLSWRVWT